MCGHPVERSNYSARRCTFACYALSLARDALRQGDFLAQPGHILEQPSRVGGLGHVRIES